MQKLRYCKGWFRAKKIALLEFSEADARERHSAEEPYCVLVGDPDRPLCFLDLAKRSVGVGFLDEHLRERLSYSFQETQPGRLFLSMATWREFEGQSDKVINGTTYIFKPTGAVHIRRESFIPAHAMEITDKVTSVEANWDEYPEFGSYGSLIRSERMSVGC
jgi:hypothetical protein